MSDTDDVATRLAALEAVVRELQQTVMELRKALPQSNEPPKPELRSRGMMDRPKPGR
jgi:hypothetical protein